MCVLFNFEVANFFFFWIGNNHTSNWWSCWNLCVHVCYPLFVTQEWDTSSKCDEFFLQYFATAVTVNTDVTLLPKATSAQISTEPNNECCTNIPCHLISCWWHILLRSWSFGCTSSLLPTPHLYSCLKMLWKIIIWNRMTASVLKQDPNTKRFKRMLIYFNTDTQYAHFSVNLLYQASKWHLNIIYKLFICCLSVVLWLDKGDFPKNLHTVCPC